MNSYRVESELMASSVFHAPSGAPSIKQLECQNYVGLGPSVTLRFNCVKTKTVMARRLVVTASKSHDGATKKLGISDAECEAAVVAGNIPEAPPVPPKPAAPAGTPVVPSLVSEPLFSILSRNRVINYAFNLSSEFFNCHDIAKLQIFFFFGSMIKLIKYARFSILNFGSLMLNYHALLLCKLL